MSWQTFDGSRWSAGEKGQENAVVKFPDPSAVVEYFRGGNARFRSAADPTKPLAMPHRAFLALVRLLCGFIVFPIKSSFRNSGIDGLS